jgi:flagellar biosynthesis protein FlhF
MRVKRYVVDSMPDALQKIRTDLGKDAVILNTKEIRSGGFLGMFSKKKIEVIAATDTAAAAPSKSAAGAAKAQTATAAVPKPSLGSHHSAKAAYSKPAAPTPTPVAKVENAEALSFPEVPDVIDPTTSPTAPHPPAAQLPMQQQAVKQPALAARSTEDVLLEELKQMKEYMHKLSVQSLQQTPTDPGLEPIQQRLLEQEMDAALVQELISAVTEEAKLSGEPLTEEYAEQSVRDKLFALFTIGESKQMHPQTRVVHFVGPTGVGKTTTIAKLAADQVLKYHRKVGFITSDTYRIAAVEQLKTYATILNVPLEVVVSPQDLSKAFEQLKDRDLIFMDTAGRNYRNEMYVSELNALLQTGGKSETYLILSLTTKYKDMKVITGNFSKFKLDKVLFTKMDETDSYGSVVNLVNDFKLQLSYVTNGQSVPDDISELSEQHIIDLILGAHNK